MTRRSTIVLSLLVAGLAAVAAAGILLAGGRDAQPVGSGTARGSAPALSGTNPITGQRVRLTDFAGRPVVVNVWASWCTGCRKEAHDLARFAAAHPEAIVLGIDFQDTASGAREFYREFGLSHPSIFDPRGDLARKLRLFGLPTTVFLNDDHREVSRIVGETDLAGFERGLDQAKRAP